MIRLDFLIGCLPQRMLFYLSPFTPERTDVMLDTHGGLVGVFFTPGGWAARTRGHFTVSSRRSSTMPAGSRCATTSAAGNNCLTAASAAFFFNDTATTES